MIEAVACVHERKQPFPCNHTVLNISYFGSNGNHITVKQSDVRSKSSKLPHAYPSVHGKNYSHYHRAYAHCVTDKAEIHVILCRSFGKIDVIVAETGIFLFKLCHFLVFRGKRTHYAHAVYIFLNACVEIYVTFADIGISLYQFFLEFKADKKCDYGKRKRNNRHNRTCSQHYNYSTHTRHYCRKQEHETVLIQIHHVIDIVAENIHHIAARIRMNDDRRTA